MSYGSRSWQLCRQLFLAVHLPCAAIFTAMSAFQAAIPLALKAAHTADAATGAIVAAIGVGRVCSALPAGYASLVFGPHRTFAASVAAMGFALIFPIAWPALLGVLAAAAAVSGFGAGASAVPRSEVLQRLLPDGRDRGAVASQLGGLFRVSYMVGPPLAALLMQHVGVRAGFGTSLPFALLAVILIVISPALRSASRELQDARAATTGAATFTGTALNLMRTCVEHRGLVGRVGTYCAAVFALRSCRLLLLTFVALEQGWQQGAVGVMLAASYAIDTVLFWVGSWVSERYGRWYTAAALPLLSVVAFCFLAVGGDWTRPSAAANDGSVTTAAPPAAPYDATTLMLSFATVSRPTITSTTTTAVPSSTVTSKLPVVVSTTALPPPPSSSSTPVGQPMSWALLAATWYVPVGAAFFGLADCFGSGLLIALVAECPRGTIGALQMLQDVGQVVGPLLVGWISAAASTRWAALCLAAVGAAMVAWGGWVLPHSPPTAEVAVAPRGVGVAAGSPVEERGATTTAVDASSIQSGENRPLLQKEGGS